MLQCIKTQRFANQMGGTKFDSLTAQIVEADMRKNFKFAFVRVI